MWALQCVVAMVTTPSTPTVAAVREATVSTHYSFSIQTDERLYSGYEGTLLPVICCLC